MRRKSIRPIKKKIAQYIVANQELLERGDQFVQSYQRHVVRSLERYAVENDLRLVTEPKVQLGEDWMRLRKIFMAEAWATTRWKRGWVNQRRPK